MRFSEGDLFYIEEKELFFLYKVLSTGENMLVRSYWPETILPGTTIISTFSVERACTEIAVDFSKTVVIGNDPVSENDREEIKKFLEIKEGLAKRKTQLLEIMKAADEFFLTEKWEEAMHLYTQAASFARNNPEIFEKRGKCFENLGMFSEAKADFGHAGELRNQLT